ncbi:MAG: hypothetical protein GWN99_15600 [Gemmatimonadetes bacterium]|uniref:Carboxypeptidase regulatory-like domain-containing protein n=1 Tax=Candidatus Kutchimonas denitrificans TaxID=3056748 RepID=A0AAE4Z5I1_9BACT|nr:hypothetical protein [Gemmatimonadota bacterium]NIR73729.1 hypothetical protein [Candidatus Kutchimonas denitrificans]NIS02469.1 hypothetical protein [Gemmatimonadota bacterium]NIT67459.1 hypothetical protein [Gemmatimonadota bacterium]NIU51591.1 hypothetical protein [Gemmatimonadota bacterium]
MRSTRFWPLALVGLLAVPASAGSLLAQDDDLTGNGAPKGPHYNLNIIGVEKEKSADMTGNQGHRIFVSLGKKKPGSSVKTRINLVQDTDGTFQVLDANGTDGGAIFQLPEPGTYTIWVRPRGQPGGEAKMTTCVDDPDYGTICSSEYTVQVRERGGRKFENVTDELTSIVLEEGSEAALECGDTKVSLFDPCLEGYFWDYDNNGLRLLQVRFYFNDDYVTS